MSFERPHTIDPSEEPESLSEISESLERCVSDDSFHEQLHTKQQVEYVDETGARHVCAYTEIVPEQLRFDRPLFFIGGFGSDAITYTEQLHALARHGRRIVYCNPTEGIPPSLELATYVQNHGVPDLFAAKCAEVLFLKERLCFGSADIVGHSQGGAVGTLACAYAPHEFENLILDTPAGLVGKVSALALAERAIAGERAEHAFAEAAAKAGDPSYMESFKRNNEPRKERVQKILWRLTQEVPAIGAMDIVPLLKDIGTVRAERGVGPHVALVTAQNDHLFPPEDVRTHLGERPFRDGEHPGLVDAWVMYANRDTGHGAFAHHDPEVVKTVVEEGESLPGRASVIMDILKEREDDGIDRIKKEE